MIKGILVVHDMLWQNADAQCRETWFGALQVVTLTHLCRNGPQAWDTFLPGDKVLE